MGTFIRIAWRNLWRNYSRSLIMIGGIGVGLFGLLVYYGISNGFINEMVQVSIELELGHVQVTRQGYYQHPVHSNSFKLDKSLIGSIENVEDVHAASGRLSAAVLVNSAEKSNRVDLVGIEPEHESRITAISSMIAEGEYLSTGQDGRIVIGRKLAEHLGVGLGDKLVVMTQDSENDLQSRLFRVGGIFESNSPLWEKAAAFVTLSSMQELLGRPNELTAILVRANREINLEPIVAGIESVVAGETAGLDVLDWKEVSPLLAQSIDMFDSFIWVFYLIIYLAMAFGVVNIMLMAVLDRTREIGVMRAVGTTPGQVMVMVLLEASLLGVAGVVVGGGAAWLVNGYYAANGLDFGRWASGMEIMGLGSVIHPRIEPIEWLVSFLSAEAAVIVSSIWPAWRSAKIEPVRAIQFE
jgi:putative ABC transport system permease protein